MEDLLKEAQGTAAQDSRVEKNTSPLSGNGVSASKDSRFCYKTVNSGRHCLQDL